MSDYEDSFELTPPPLAKLREWLEPTDYDGDGSEYHRHISSYTPDTDEWIFDTPEWKAWHDGHDDGFLRLVGIPGSGKSVLAAHLIRRLASEKVPVLFFFFRQIIDANHTPQALLRDWLAQLLPSSLPLQLEIGSLIEAGRQIGSVSTEDLWKFLRQAIHDQPRIYAVADALDEMDAGNDDFLRSLAELGRWKPSTLKVLTTSRPDPSVEQALRPTDLEALGIRLEQRLVDVDIAKYVSHRLTGTSISTEDQTRIREAVPGRASGLFLYARLAMDRFVESSADITHVLKHLPLDLDCMYTNLLNEHARRSGISLEAQLHILSWVTHATRPLRLLELATIIDFLRESSRRDLKASKALVRKACGPLIEVLPDETLSVCHHTLTEFLKGQKRSGLDSEPYPVLFPMQTHTSLATSCLRYLRGGCLNLQTQTKGEKPEAVKGRSSRRKRDSDSGSKEWHAKLEKDRLKRIIQMDHPFSLYAAKNWHVHAARAIDHSAPDELINALNVEIDGLLEPKLERRTLLALSDVGGESDRYGASIDGIEPLHIAAWAGLESYTRSLLNGGVDVNERDDNNGTPMHWAASHGRGKVVSVLLENGALPDVDNDQGLKPLHLAAVHDCAEIVRLLLRAGVDPMTPKTQDSYARRCGNSPTSIGETPLLHACRRGAMGAMTEFWPFLQPEQKLQSLHWAVKENQPHLVESIIQRSDIDSDARLYSNTALYLACQDRSTRIIEILVQAGSDPNANHDRATRLRYFHRTHDWKDATGEPGDTGSGVGGLTPMHALASKSNTAREATEEDLSSALDILIQAGGDIRRVDPSGKTMLHHACEGQHYLSDDPAGLSLVRRLLAAGLDANAIDQEGRTPLHMCMNDHKGKLRRLLIEEGNADVNKPDAGGFPPLISLLASRQWHIDPSGIEDLLSFYPNCDVFDKDGNTPLHLVLRGLGSTGFRGVTILIPIIKALIAAGADPRARNTAGETPLHVITFPFDMSSARSQDGQREIIQLLLSKGADLESRDRSGKTVLFRFLREGHTQYQAVFSVFLSLGSQLDTRDFSGRTLLHELIHDGGRLDLLQWLVSQGLDLGAVDGVGNTLLHEAALVGQLSRLSRNHPVLDLPADQRNNCGQTALMMVSRMQSEGSSGLSGLELLLARCKVIDASDDQGVTAIHTLSCLSEEGVAQLLDAGADMAAVTRDKLTALHLAARSRQSNIVGLLCDRISAKGLDLIDAKDSSGRTALHHACRSGKVESVATLLRAGASVDVRDDKGLTPLSACAEYEIERELWCDDNARSLYISDVSLRARDRPRRTQNPEMPSDPRLYRNAHVDNENNNSGIDDIVDLLISHGADVSLKTDQFGNTILSNAMSYALSQGLDNTYGCFMRLRDRLGLANEVMSYPALESILMHRRLAGESLAFDEWTECCDRGLDEQTLSLLLYERRYNLIAKIIETCHDKDVLNVCKGKFIKLGFARLLETTFQQESRTENVDATPPAEDNQGNGEHRPLLIAACGRSISNLEVLKVIMKQPSCRLDEHVRRRKHSQYYVGWVDSETALHVLAGGRYWWQVAEGLPLLIESGADIEARDDNGLTPLQASLGSGWPKGYHRKQASRLLIERGADVNAVTSDGQSCLSMTHDPELLELLVKHGAKLSASALFAAVRDVKPSLLQTLLQLGADPNARMRPDRGSADDDQGSHWFHERERRAGRKRHISVSELYVLHYVARERPQRLVNGPPLDHSANLAMLRALLEHGADPYLTFIGPITSPDGAHHEEDQDGEQSIVHQAFSCGLFLEPFLEISDLDMHIRDVQGRTLFLTACSRNWSLDNQAVTGLPEGTTLLQHLLSRGADMCAKDKADKNALHICLASHRPDADITMIMDKVPHLVAEADSEGDCPFHLAARFGRTTLINQMLHLPGVDFTIPDSLGNTPLHHFATRIGERQRMYGLGDTEYELRRQYKKTLDKSVASLDQFLALGIPINSRNNEGSTPLESYVTKFIHTGRAGQLEKFKSELEIFTSAGADLRCRNLHQQTLLHIVVSNSLHISMILASNEAVSDNVAKIFETLVSMGLDPWAEDDGQRTSLDVASVNGYEAVVQLFEGGKGKEKRVT